MKQKTLLLMAAIMGILDAPLKADVGGIQDKDIVTDTSKHLDEPKTESWLDHAITPVTNPVWFEDARITTELRLIMIHHQIDKDFITDIAVGLKYQAYRSDADQFLVTPGITIEIPLGNTNVFQGNGDGMFQPFVSLLKGFDRLQFAGNLGVHIPVNFSDETAQLHYSLHAHYDVCRYFIPLVEVNGFTVLSEADAFPSLDSEGMDLINFGAGNAGGGHLHQRRRRIPLQNSRPRRCRGGLGKTRHRAGHPF